MRADDPHDIARMQSKKREHGLIKLDVLQYERGDFVLDVFEKRYVFRGHIEDVHSSIDDWVDPIQ